jgi:hypothetical protein
MGSALASLSGRFLATPQKELNFFLCAIKKRVTFARSFAYAQDDNINEFNLLSKKKKLRNEKSKVALQLPFSGRTGVWQDRCFVYP